LFFHSFSGLNKKANFIKKALTDEAANMTTFQKFDITYKANLLACRGMGAMGWGGILINNI
jgi:hypothetical protein